MLKSILNIGKAIVSSICAIAEAVINTVANIIEAPVNIIKKTKVMQKAASTPKSKQSVGQKVATVATKTVSLPLLTISFLLRIIGSVFDTCYSYVSDSINTNKSDDDDIEITEEDIDMGININLEDEDEETTTTGGAFCL